MKNHYHSPEDKTTASVSNTAAPASSRPEHNKQDRGSSSMRHKSNGEERPHHHNSNSSGGNSSSKQRNSKNGSSGRSGGGHRGQSHRNSSSAAAANVKKFTHNEVVGPPPKKTGCCRVMWAALCVSGMRNAGPGIFTARLTHIKVYSPAVIVIKNLKWRRSYTTTTTIRYFKFDTLQSSSCVHTLLDYNLQNTVLYKNKLFTKKIRLENNMVDKKLIFDFTFDNIICYHFGVDFCK